MIRYLYQLLIGRRPRRHHIRIRHFHNIRVVHEGEMVEVDASAIVVDGDHLATIIGSRLIAERFAELIAAHGICTLPNDTRSIPQ